MNEELNLATIPQLPQAKFLHQLAPLLWQLTDVQALWLEGSMGRGNADLYSDVDLYITVAEDALEGWRSIAIADLFAECYLAHSFSNFAEDFFVYHVYLTEGGIYDLHIQPPSRTLPKAKRLFLAFRDEQYKAQVATSTLEEAGEPLFPPQPVEPNVVQRLIVDFWMNADKSRKVLYRNQVITSYVGLHLFRQWLLRLLFIEATNSDCGDLIRPSIHAFKAIAAVLNPFERAELGEIMGKAATNRQEMLAAQARLQQEFARVGRVLAARYQFEYPAALEQAIQQNWQAFIA